MNKGFTLVEMVVVMVLGIMMLMAVGAISDIGSRGHQRIANESAIYNDIAYGFKLIQNRVHEAVDIDDQSAASPWIGDKLVADNEAFGVYDEGASGKYFVHLPNKDDESDRKSILSVLDTDTMQFSVSHYAHPVTRVTMTLSGSKGGVPFSMTATVSNRI